MVINQVRHSKNGLQPQLIRYVSSGGTNAPNQSLMLSVNGLLTLKSMRSQLPWQEQFHTMKALCDEKVSDRKDIAQMKLQFRQNETKYKLYD